MLEVNETYCRMSGYTRAELLSMSVSDVEAKESPRDTEQHMATIMVRGEDRFETTHRRKDGSTFDAEVSTQYREFDGGQFIAFVKDISARKEIETALRTQEQQLRMYIDRSPVAILVADAAGRYTEINPAACAMLGYTRDEMLRMSIREINTAATTMSLPNSFLTLRNEGIISAEVQLRRKDGTIVPVLLNAVKLTDDRFISFCVDISAHKRAEALSSELAAIVHSSQDAIIGKDLGGNITSWNAGAESLFGYSAEEMRGQSITRLIPPERLDEERMIFGKILKGERVEAYETKRLRKDGTLVDISVSISPIRDDTGTIVGASKVARDDSERNRNHEMISRLLRDKDLLLHEVHHRIKNNINSIRSLLKVQARNSQNPEALEILNTAADRLQSMSVLYDKLYRSSDISSVSLKEYLPSLVADIARNFSNSTAITINTDIADITLDPKTSGTMGIIVNELLSNSLKHAFSNREEGQIWITAVPDDHHLKIVVRDNGKGFSSDSQAAEKRNFGLNLVRMLTDQLSGTCSVDSREGTRWTIELPLPADAVAAIHLENA
jgi:PAS domain S-box-containing protein